jgi:hypothetical protein
MLDASLDEAQAMLDEAQQTLDVARQASANSSDETKRRRTSGGRDGRRRENIEEQHAASVELDPTVDPGEVEPNNSMTNAGYDEAVHAGEPFRADEEQLAIETVEPVASTEVEQMSEDELVLQGAGRDLRPDTLTPAPTSLRPVLPLLKTMARVLTTRACPTKPTRTTPRFHRPPILIPKLLPLKPRAAMQLTQTLQMAASAHDVCVAVTGSCASRVTADELFDFRAVCARCVQMNIKCLHHPPTVPCHLMRS